MDAPTPAELLDAEGDLKAAKKEKMDKRREQIEWWLRNRVRPNATGKTKGSGSTLSLANKKIQILAPYQSYLHLHAERVMAQVNKDYANYTAKLAPGEKPRHSLSFVQEVAKRLLSEAPDNIKEEVETYRQKHYKEQVPTPITYEGLLTEGIEAAQQKTQTLQNSINLLARTGLEALKAIETQTGFKGTFFVGGPNPETGQNVTLAIHNGTTLQLGNIWSEACDNWPTVQASFDKFIARCFPAELPKQLESLFSGEPIDPILNGPPVTTAHTAATTGNSTPASTVASCTAALPDGTISTASTDPSAAPLDGQLGDSPNAQPETPKAVRRAVTPEPSYDEIVRARHARNLRIFSVMEKRGVGAEEAQRVVDEDGDLNEPREEPEWIGEAKGYLEEVSDQAWWRELVEAWVQFEAGLGYPDGANQRNWISAKGRPEEARNWINRARNYNKPPKIKSVSAFIGTWRKWWTGVQPPCRQPEDGHVSWPLERVAPENNGDWSKVRRGGCNGLFMAIMCLAWWFDTLQKSNSDLGDLLTAVDDVKWVLTYVTPDLVVENTGGKAGASSSNATPEPTATSPPAVPVSCPSAPIPDHSACTATLAPTSSTGIAPTVNHAAGAAPPPDPLSHSKAADASPPRAALSPPGVKAADASPAAVSPPGPPAGNAGTHTAATHVNISLNNPAIAPPPLAMSEPAANASPPAVSPSGLPAGSDGTHAVIAPGVENSLNNSLVAHPPPATSELAAMPESSSLPSISPPGHHSVATPDGAPPGSGSQSLMPAEKNNGASPAVNVNMVVTPSTGPVLVPGGQSPPNMPTALSSIVITTVGTAAKRPATDAEEEPACKKVKESQ